MPGNLAVPAVGSCPTVSPLPAPSLAAPPPRAGRRGRAVGGLFSVALSRGRPLSGCPEQPALRSPDLPQGHPRGSLAVSLPQASPRVPTTRAHPQYTPKRGPTVEGPQAVGTEKDPSRGEEPSSGGHPEEGVRPAPRSSPLGSRRPLRGEELQEPLGEVHHSHSRLGTVRRDPRLRDELLPLRVGQERGRPLSSSGRDLPPLVLAPQTHDKERIGGQPPRREDRPRIRREIPKRIVPTRNVHEGHPPFPELPDEVLQPLAICPQQGLTVVVDRADLRGKGRGCG